MELIGILFCFVAASIITYLQGKTNGIYKGLRTYDSLVKSYFNDTPVQNRSYEDFNLYVLNKRFNKD